MNPPSNIRDIYKSQGWNDPAAIDADIAAGGWQNKVPAGGSSGNNVDLSAPSILDFSEKAYAGADDALKQYVMQLKSQQNPLDVYSKLETAAGLPQQRATAATLREQIGGLEDTIRRVEPDVNATTTNSLVTEGQRSGMINARRKPLLENLSTLTTGLGRIEQGITANMQGLDTKTNLFLKGQENALKPYEVQYTAMNDRAARMVSGFTADAQNQLQITMAKWNRNNELTDQETNRAFELLKMEKSYSQEMEKLQAQSKLELDQYIAKQPIDLSTYEKQKQIDQKYKTSDSTDSTGVVDTSGYYTNPGTSSYYGGSAYVSGGNNGTSISDLWNSATK